MQANRDSASTLLTASALAAAAADQESTWAAEMAALAGIGFALLDVADAIREQTAELHPGGIRDDLAEIGHALRKIADSHA